MSRLAPLQPMTLEEIRQFAEDAPWRQVKGTPEGPLNKPPDPHEYIIREWKEIDSDQFERFALTIRRLGHKGRYTAPYNGRTMTNDYLEVEDAEGTSWCFWYIYPKMLNRCRAEAKQHEPLEPQLALEDQPDQSEGQLWEPKDEDPPEVTTIINRAANLTGDTGEKR